MREPCQCCGDLVEDRAWDAILKLWVGDCCHVTEEYLRKSVQVERGIEEASGDEVA
jgi:hypothetical protein